MAIICLSHLVASAQANPPFKVLQKQVKDIYEGMTFSGLDLNVTGIPLINMPANVAFAQFDPKTNKRYILINYAFFLANYCNKDTGKLLPDGVDIIKGLLSHEWAHHYMGHTFERNTIIKERNADIISGRIMYENITKYRPIGNKVNDNDLATALRVGTLFTRVGQFHSARNFRDIMMRKGFILGLIIDYKRDTNGPKLLFKELIETKTQEIQKGIDELKINYINRSIVEGNKELERQRELERLKRDSLNELKHDMPIRTDSLNRPDSLIQNSSQTSTGDTVLSIPVSTTITSDSVFAQPVQGLAIKASKAASLPKLHLEKGKPLMWPNTTGYPKYIKKVVEHEMNSFKKDLNSRFGKFFKEKILTIDSNLIWKTIKIDSITLETEAIYNIVYLDSIKGEWNKKFGPIIKRLTANNLKIDSTTNLVYKLHGDLNFTLSGLNKIVTLTYNGQKAIHDSTQFKSDSAKFLYAFYFPVERVRFFIDNNYNLWTETVGAKSLRNKLFLQTNQFVEP